MRYYISDTYHCFDTLLQLVVQSYRVFVLVRKNVVPTRDIPPLGTKAIGKPINTKVVHDLSSEKGLKVCAEISSHDTILSDIRSRSPPLFFIL